MNRNLSKVFFSIGSNSGDRYSLINIGLRELKKLSADQCLIVSSVYESEPWGDPNQTFYLNCAAFGFFSENPQELLFKTQAIEKSTGRKTNQRKWGPRTLDIDILVSDEEILATEHLKIPHPYLSQRKFVLLPLCEIAEDLVIPGSSNTVGDLLKVCQDEGRVYKYAVPHSSLIGLSSK